MLSFAEYEERRRRTEAVDRLVQECPFTVADVCAAFGKSAQTYYRWKYLGLTEEQKDLILDGIAQLATKTAKAAEGCR